MMKLLILLRSLTNKWFTSLIIVTGFTVSISIVLVLLAYLISEFRTDRFYTNTNSIYRVLANGNLASVREDFRDYFSDNYPEIKYACRYNRYQTTLTLNDVPFSGQMIVTDSTFFNIFTPVFIVGSPSAALNSPNDIVLTKSFAAKVFGNQDPVGKVLVAEYKFPLTVTGIINDFPENSSIKGDFLTNSTLKIWYEGSSDGQGNEVNYFRLFIMTDLKADIAGLEKKLSTDISSIKYTIGYQVEEINLLPFKESYFTQGINRSLTDHANIRLIRLLSLIAFIIIILAIINYINLMTAGFSDRHKEIAIMKTLGASRATVFFQFLAESVFLCLVSFIAAIFISSSWLPLFVKFIGKSVHLNLLYSPEVLVMVVIGVIAISIIAGLYPALIISRLNPVSIFSRKGQTTRKFLSLRGVLNIFQYAVSAVLIISLLVITRQIEYVRATDFGFERDLLLRVDVHWQLSEKLSSIRDRLLQEPTIKDVSFSHGTPGSIYRNGSFDAFGEDDNIINILTTDTSFFNVFKIPVISGRELMPSDLNKVCYLNETAFKKTGWTTYEGQKYWDLEIIGIVRDFHFENLYNKISPLVILVSSDMSVSNLTIRVDKSNYRRTVSALEATWKEVCPSYELKFQFYDEWLNSMYQEEEKLVSAIWLFSILALMISCLGILGIAEYSIRKRTREIGIRKINGARALRIMFSLNIDFIKWVLFSLVVSVPLSYFLMTKWLSTFAYREDLSWWMFAAGAAIVMIVATGTVSLKSWRAATKNPSDALRYE